MSRDRQNHFSNVNVTFPRKLPLWYFLLALLSTITSGILTSSSFDLDDIFPTTTNNWTRQYTNYLRTPCAVVENFLILSLSEKKATTRRRAVTLKQRPAEK